MYVQINMRLSVEALGKAFNRSHSSMAHQLIAVVTKRPPREVKAQRLQLHLASVLWSARPSRLKCN